MDYKRALGFTASGIKRSDTKKLIQYINLKLVAISQPAFQGASDNKFLDIAKDLIENHKEKNRLLSNYLCPADLRIQNFLKSYFEDLDDVPEFSLPTNSFVLDRHGIARVLSIPPDKDEFVSDIISSYRLKQGILHNPKSDRRTTQGVFHIAEGGLPIPDDKKAVPKIVFANLLTKALNPPKELMELPFTSSQTEKARSFVSLLLRPAVMPEVKGFNTCKSMEIRFFAPGNLVSNLDFVESIFGNAGDPYLSRNDAALDCDHWTGHTGCVILAPHLIYTKKKELGLPNIKNATERQIRDGMCWENEDELYNGGQAFKITCRNEKGVIVTVIADNYFGYSKKEIKTQVSFSANLYGNCEEEHAGGAIAFPSYSLGNEFIVSSLIKRNEQAFSDIIKKYSSFIELQPEGYGIDKNYPDIIYIPEDTILSINENCVKWNCEGKEQSIKLLNGKTYIYPFGYRVKLQKVPSGSSWRLVGTNSEGTLCHKPSTVSGGGKSEISKSISDAIIYRPFYVADFTEDMKLVEEIMDKDYTHRFIVPADYSKQSPRSLLSPNRSLGSAIKLLTPSPMEYTEEYNDWLMSIPPHVKGLAYVIKRFYQPEWGNDWKSHFSVDIIDGNPGNELKFDNRKLIAGYLRVGVENNGNWRTYKLRQDFVAADKIQFEDDITASTVVPSDKLEYLNPEYKNQSVKFVHNCEYRFFQRPDEAVNRGYDKQAEMDIASPDTFISNFEPLTVEDAKNLIQDAIGFDQYTKPMQNLIKSVAEKKDCSYFVSSSHPRIFEGKPSKNMRYLQSRPDVINPKNKYIAEVSVRLQRKIPAEKPVYFPVNSVLPGRRNNPPEPGIRPLAVYNPIHYQELPELFMDFISSLTGKSPSTTGAGSEGALTKAPFNALCPVTDLNNALVSFMLTGYNGFTSAAGYIGPKYKVDHDISLLIPELWCRLSEDERDPEFLIKEDHFEKLNDFEHNGKKVLASRLGYRMTSKFAHTFMGRIFENPTAVFNYEMLKPEIQDIEVFVDGINNITEAQKRVAQSYFDDGSITAAIPPLKAILHIMVCGEYEGLTEDSTEFREMFSRKYLLESDWYRDRLLAKQLNDISQWQKNIMYLKEFLRKSSHLDEAESLHIKERLASAEKMLETVKSQNYLKGLTGTIGCDIIYK
ncbi:MAG: hypothetical protein GXX85_09740 [Ignavibacteria bacterium]|nr:hypothetical protein [Ignavibacteria bacterium]